MKNRKQLLIIASAVAIIIFSGFSWLRHWAHDQMKPGKIGYDPLKDAGFIDAGLNAKIIDKGQRDQPGGWGSSFYYFFPA